MSPRWAAAAALALLLWAVEPARASDGVEGRVRGPGGVPVSGADLDVYDAATGIKLAASDNTDNEGRYDLALPPGSYHLVVQPTLASGLAPRGVRGLRVGEGTTFLDWDLLAAVRQLGVVRSEAGLPVEGADLDFDRSSDGFRQPVLGDRTSRFGTCAVIIEPGLYTLTVQPPIGSSLAPTRRYGWDVTRGDTIRVALPVARRLRGTILDDAGTPVRGARLVFDAPGVGRWPAVDRDSDSLGVVAAGVEPGRYRVTVEPPPGSRLVAVRLGEVDLTTDAERHAVLRPGVILSGRVTDAAGRPVPDADWDVTDAGSGTSVPTPDDGTDADGRYRLVLPSGTFRLTLTLPAHLHQPPIVHEGVAVVADTTFDVALAGEPPPTPAEWRLAARRNPSAGTAELLMELPQGAPSAEVALFDAGGRHVRQLHRGPLAAGRHVIAWDGRHRGGDRAHTGVYFARLVIPGVPVTVARFVLVP